MPWVLPAIPQYADPVADQLEEVAVLRYDDQFCVLRQRGGIAGDPVVRFAVGGFGEGNAQLCQRREDVRQLGEWCVIFRHLAVIRAVGFVVLVQIPALVGAFAVKQHRNMCRGYHAEHFQQSTHDSQCTLNGFAVSSGDPGGHAVKHLEQQVAAVHDHPFFHPISSGNAGQKTLLTLRDMVF